jgi:hypothetical protein
MSSFRFFDFWRFLQEFRFLIFLKLRNSIVRFFKICGFLISDFFHNSVLDLQFFSCSVRSFNIFWRFLGKFYDIFNKLHDLLEKQKTIVSLKVNTEFNADDFRRREETWTLCSSVEWQCDIELVWNPSPISLFFGCKGTESKQFFIRSNNLAIKNLKNHLCLAYLVFSNFDNQIWVSKFFILIRSGSQFLKWSDLICCPDQDHMIYIDLIWENFLLYR